MPKDIDIRIDRKQHMLDIFQKRRERLESRMMQTIGELSLLKTEKIEKEKIK